MGKKKAVVKKPLARKRAAVVKKSPKPGSEAKANPLRIMCWSGHVFDRNPKYNLRVSCPVCAQSVGVAEGRQHYLQRGGKPTTREQVRAELRARMSAALTSIREAQNELAQAVHEMMQLDALDG